MKPRIAVSVSALMLFTSALVSTTVAAGPPAAPPGHSGEAPAVGRSIQHDRSPALREMPALAAPPGISKFRSKRWARLPRHLASQPHVAVDPAVQGSPGATALPSTSANFEGLSNGDQVGAGIVPPGGVVPPDPVADVGPNHVVQWVNVSFAVYNKAGVKLYGPAAGNTLWQNFSGPCESENNGDPIVLYDHLADRWLLSQLAVPNFPDGPFYQCIAISTTGDPLGSYFRYAFVTSQTLLNDYPKLGVWPDGYYLAVNQFFCYDIIPPFGFIACDWAGQGAFAFERDKMLLGQAAQMVGFGLPTSNLGGMLPADLDGLAPPAGTPNYFVQVDDDAWLGPNDPWGPDTDRLQVWAFHVDWTTPANTTFTQVIVLPTAAFDSNMCGYQTSCIPQPGVDILGDPSPPVDALADRLMFRLQYRNFGTHETLVANHTVDVNASDQAGIRWYELRRNCAGGVEPWCIHQQGTYAPSDGDHRWMGSLAMDSAGNMALGYSVSSLTTYPSLRYVGREAGDPLGTMGQEATIIDGTGYQLTSASRWGDYSSMSVDPTDDCTFWYTGEYYQTADIFYGSNWQTRIASFKFPSCGPSLPTLSITDGTVIEGNGGTVDATFTVSLSAASSQEVTVQYATANGTATAGSDYTAIPLTTLTFAPGETSKTVTVLVNGDTLDEPNEAFVVNLSNAVNATIADTQGLGTITNDDPVPALAIGDATVTEGNSGTVNAVFTVSLSAASGQTVTVQHATANGTATAGSDYTAIPLTTLTFAPGETSKAVTVLVKGDTSNEVNETFFVNLSSATNATIADSQGIGTITNDDTAAGSITVLVPNGGETWRVNQNRTIQWTSSGVTGNVRIEISRNGVTEVLFGSTANDGTQKWKVIGPATTQARIKVCDIAGTVCDESNALFTIK